MKNNQGFTLVELIVVIAIMSIIAGVSSNVMTSVSNQELKDFVNSYDAMLSECKIETLSGMKSPSLEIVVENGEYRAVLYENGTVVKKQYLGEDYLTCKFKEDGTEKTITSTNTLTISYDRNTGAFVTGLEGITEVSVSNKRGITYSVELIPQTGYHKVVR